MMIANFVDFCLLSREEMLYNKNKVNRRSVFLWFPQKTIYKTG